MVRREHFRPKTPPQRAWRLLRRVFTAATVRFALAAALATFFLPGARAQNPKKSKDKGDDATSGVNLPPVPDGQAIDLAVGQMLGAWQVGDVEKMHQFIADDVVTISGNFEPPLIGWDTYLRAYQEQRARSQGGRLERTNTLAKIVGDTAWVTYQWEFIGQVDGAPLDAVGHTTLLLQKRAGNWLIVLNHTSTVPLPPRSTAAPAPAPSATNP